MKRLRIGIDLRALVPEPTGIGVATLSILEQLADDPKLEFIGLAHAAPHAAAQLDALGIEVEIASAPLGVLWQRLRLPRRLAKGDLDLFWSPLLTLPPRPAIPAVVTVHDLTPILLPQAHNWKVRLSTRPFMASSLAAAHTVVACSAATAADIERLFPDAAGKTRVIYNGVDPGFRPGEPQEIEATRRGLGLPDGFVLFCGTLEPRKNVLGLLAAWELLKTDRPASPPLVLTGPYGWHSQEAVARIRELEGVGVRHLGRLPRSRLMEVIRAASVFVFPSLYEGFGLPVLEAMASGVPTIASAVSSLPEVTGDAALLVDPNDAREIATSIDSVLAQPELAADLARRGVDRARSFSWRRAADEMREVFKAAASSRA